MGALSDAELVAAMDQGNEDALAEVYARYGATVYLLVDRLCGREAAEDVTHEVFLAIWQVPRAFDPEGGSLAPRLHSVAHRRAVALLRSTSSGPTSKARRASRRHRGSLALTLGEDQRLRTLLADLSASQRQAIVLAYFAGYTRREIAEHLSESDETVKRDIGIGMVRLRDHLERQRQS